MSRVPPGPEARPQILYGIDDRPPLGQAVPLGIQHVLAMILGNITPPLLIGGALGLPADEIAVLIQAVLVMAGIATLVQSYPIGPVGARLPIIMGTSVAFVGALTGIAKQWGLPAVFGACLAAAAIEVVLGFAIGKLRRLFPPLVNGVVVMLIGLTLIPVGMDYAAGGIGAIDYGSLTNLAIAALVGVVTLVLNQFARGFLSHASLLFGVLAGYALALGFDKVSFTAVSEASWLAAPKIAEFGLEFHGAAILLVCFVYIVSAMETLGDISGTVAIENRDATDRELRGGLVADGVMSGLAALVGALPNTSYSQNVGLVNFTGIASRHVTAIGGGFLILLGVTPKVSALFATLPPAVIGGGGLIMFGMIFASGANIIHRGVTMNRRSMVILAVALALGLGIEMRPDALQMLSSNVRALFGSGLITGGLTALVLNLVLPKER